MVLARKTDSEIDVSQVVVKNIDLEKSRALVILYARMRGIVLIKILF
jgi:hypothetical protein